MSERSVWQKIVIVCISAVAALAASTAHAQWQGLCGAGTWVELGPGQFQCAPAAPPVQRPSFQPNYGASPPFEPTNTPVMREMQALGGMLMSDAPLPQNIPLSSGLVLMHNTQAPPPAPTNYIDPFTNGPGWSPPAKPQAPVATTTVGPNGLNRNLSDVGTMQMQPAPSQHNNGNGTWQNSDPYNTHCTGAFKC
jgi:hypothetical protein